MKKKLRLMLRRRILILFLLLLQLLSIAWLLDRSAAQYRVLSVLLNVISFVVAIYIVNRNEKPGYNMAWLALVLTVPLFGGMLYLLFRLQSSVDSAKQKYAKYDESSRRYLIQDPIVEEQLQLRDPELAKHCRYLSRATGYPVYRNTEATYLSCGERLLPVLLEELRRAKRYIFLEYFIIAPGSFWDAIENILVQKAREGVDVRVLYDDMGCMFRLGDDFCASLREKGIRCIAFNPFRPFWSTLQNNRDHRKIIAIDGNCAFTGGINLADEYINAIERFGYWKDSAVMLRGDAAWSFTVMFLNMWDSIQNIQEDISLFRPDAPLPGLRSAGFFQPYCDSPTDNEYVNERVYLQTINGAEKYLYIATPYLIVEENVVNALALAAKSGVDVRIITPHIPDKKFVHLVTRSNYLPLIEAGVHIFEYRPGFVHAKIFISDDKVAINGTANLDFRSLYLLFECGVRMIDRPTVTAMRQDFLSTLEQCVEISAQEMRSRPLPVRMLQAILRIFSPLF